MRRRFGQFRAIGRSTFPRDQRSLDVLGVLSIVMLLGVSLSGVWQFFAHRPDPAWFGYVPGTDFEVAEQNSTVAAQIHGFFGTGSGIVALVGTVWFAYRIAYGFPAAAVVAVACTFFAALVGTLVRFNLIKVHGLAFDEVGPGYAQVFTGEVEYVVSDTGQMEPGVFRGLILAHIATVPILVSFGLWSIARAIDRRTLEIENAPKRTWFV